MPIAEIAKRIFTAEDAQRLRETERSLADTIEILDAAGECGVHCEDLKSLRSELAGSLAKIRTTFMPDF